MKIINIIILACAFLVGVCPAGVMDEIYAKQDASSVIEEYRIKFGTRDIISEVKSIADPARKFIVIASNIIDLDKVSRKLSKTVSWNFTFYYKDGQMAGLGVKAADIGDAEDRARFIAQEKLCVEGLNYSNTVLETTEKLLRIMREMVQSSSGEEKIAFERLYNALNR